MRLRRRIDLAALMTAALLLGAALGLLACATGSSSRSDAQTGAQPHFDGAALPGLGVSAPGFTLADQDGRPVTLSSLRGQVVVLAFLYPRCGGPCDLIAQQIRGALDDLTTPAAVLIVNVGPQTPHAPGAEGAAVRSFLARVGLSRRARVLSGTRARLLAVARAYHVAQPRAGAAAFGRTSPVVLIDRSGRERVLFQVEVLTPDALAHDLEELSGGATGG